MLLGWSGMIYENISKIQNFINFFTFFVTHFLSGTSLPVVHLSWYLAKSKLKHSFRGSSEDLLICEVYLSKVWGQRVKVTNQRGDPKNQPKAGPEAKVRESASHHLFKNHRFLHENAVFLVLECFRVDLGWFMKIRQNSNVHYFFHILCDTFPLRYESSCWPFELILSQIKVLI